MTIILVGYSILVRVGGYMKKEIFSRTKKLIGDDQLDNIHGKTVALFGVGGVGSFVGEALVRAGVGKIIIVDKDVIDPTNINRQLVALTSTIGKPKVQVAKERYKDINPEIEVETHEIFYLKDTMDQVDLSKCDYVVDAIDTVTAKILVIEEAKKLDVPVISCLGTGNKLNAHYFKIEDISKTSICPLAKVMRKELKKREIYGVKVLFSTESPVKRSNPPASISFVPSVAGLLIAGEVIRDLMGDYKLEPDDINS